MLDAAVRELNQTIVDHDGTNAANGAFVRRVDDLISVFYDDIGEISAVSTQTLFKLFVIKVLYVERCSTDAGVIEYLARLLERYLDARELFPAAGQGRFSVYYLSDLLRETERPGHVQNLFEAYRRCGDNSLFVTGVFPKALRRPRRGRSRAHIALVDRSYYVATGKRFDRLAARHELAESIQQRELPEELSEYFEVYRVALNEMSERYIMGFDLHLIADKMLDSFNQYRRTGEDRFLQNARRYAAILRVDAEAFPSLLKRGRPRGRLLRPQPAY